MESVFEEKVFENLLASGINLAAENCPRLGAAVSGGADSVSLLLSLSFLCKKYNKTLSVVTVNHRIRSESESGGDALFVKELCDSFKNQGFKVELYTVELEEGQVTELSRKRKCGIEEAARYLRYNAFNDFKSLFNLDYVCLAHNENDNLETILMRFLQGSATGGIKEKRDFYIRPLINIKRSEIESYLKSKNQEWRTDNTNFDESYLRNRIRLSLIPLLDEKFSGWKKALLSGAQKDSLDEDYFQNEIEKIKPFEKSENFVSFEREKLRFLHKSILYRLFFYYFTELKVQIRFPFKTLMDFIERLTSGLEKYSLELSQLELTFDENMVLIKKPEKIATESAFFAIIERSGQFDFPFGVLSVEEKGNGKIGLKFETFELEIPSLPVLVRSRAPDDRIKTSSGTCKSVNDILASWHVSQSDKDLIPLVQDLTGKEQKLLGIIGSVRNYKNWIVRG